MARSVIRTPSRPGTTPTRLATSASSSPNGVNYCRPNLADSASSAAFSGSRYRGVCRELGDAVIGAQIPNLIAPLKVSEDPASRSGTKWKRLFNVVVTAQNRQQDGRPMIRLISEIMRPVRFDSVEGFSAHRHSLNGRLLLYGYEIRDDGRVGRVAVASTLAEAQQRANELHSELSRRNVHADVLAFCRTELLQQNYFHAVLEAAKSVADKIRARTGFNLDGNRLAMRRSP
jgi:hypothetical protein